MTRLMLDRTARTAVTPNPRLWDTMGIGSSVIPVESGGYIDFSNSVATWAMTLLSNCRRVTTDFGVLCKVNRTLNAGTSRLRLWLAHDGSIASSSTTGETPNTGLCVNITATGDISLLKISGGTGTTLAGPTTAAITPINTDWFVRAERTAGVFRIRYWLASGAEPTTWQFSVTDDGTLSSDLRGTYGNSAGIPAITAYVGTSGGTTTRFKVAQVSYYTPAGGLYPVNRPRIMQRLDGTRIPFGRSTQTLADDSTTAAPSSLFTLTGLTAGQDVRNGLRTLQAASGSTGTIAFPAMSGEAMALTLHNMVLSSDTDAGLSLIFTDGSGNTYQARSLTSDTLATLVSTGAVAASQQVPYQVRGGGEGILHRTITLVYLPSQSQFVLLEGTLSDGTIIGWLPIPATILDTSSITASVALTAGSAAETLSYNRLTLDVQRN